LQNTSSSDQAITLIPSGLYLSAKEEAPHLTLTLPFDLLAPSASRLSLELKIWETVTLAEKDNIFESFIMPVPLAPYPTPPAPYTPPANGAQSQLVCSGCRNLLVYPVGATSVCCAVCNAVTAVPPPGTEMAQLVCGGCHTLLMYIRGATSVQCSCCHTVNLALEANQVAHVNCGNCRMLLMYQYGARSVKCAVCNFVTSVGVSATASTTEQKFST
ncbi:Protein LOL1, partial [Mucuna pruriens]